MKIGLRGGHSPNCKGAVGILDEQKEVRNLYYKIKNILEKNGHTVIDCNSNASTQSQELKEGTDKCNRHNCDVYIPLHMNASRDKNGNGVECWVYGKASSSAINIANRVNENLSSLELYNRGIKYKKTLHDTRATICQTCLIEICFCDNKNDTDIYKNNIDKIAFLIAQGIDPNIKDLDKNKFTKYDENTPKGPSIFELGNTGFYIEKRTDGNMGIHLDKGNYIILQKGKPPVAYYNNNNGNSGSKQL